MNDRVVEFESGGREVQYVRYSARIPGFLARFPPEQGFSVTGEVTDILALQKGRLSLLTAAINAGRKLSDIGLPGIERDLNKLVYRVKLTDREGKVLRDASASMDVIDYKDYETLESAAHQRLLAALGFGGELFDADEESDFAHQSLRPVAASAPALSAATPAAPASRAAGEETPSAQLPEAGEAASDAVPDAMRRQVANLASRLNEPVPEMKTRADAQAALAKLGDLSRVRRTASAA